MIHLRVRTHQHSPVQSSPVQSSPVQSSPVQSDSRVTGCSHRPGRVQVCASPSGFLVLLEQRARKEVSSDAEHACFARDYVEKEVAS